MIESVNCRLFPKGFNCLLRRDGCLRKSNISGFLKINNSMHCWQKKNSCIELLRNFFYEYSYTQFSFRKNVFLILGKINKKNKCSFTFFKNHISSCEHASRSRKTACFVLTNKISFTLHVLTKVNTIGCSA